MRITPRNTRASESRRAFTLIELLIVVAIIAILAAIAVPNFLEAQTRSKVSRVKADMRTLATAMESYTVDNNRPSVVRNIVGENRIDRYRWLTTPIAYMTSAIKDPFMTGAGADPLQDVLILWGPGVTGSDGIMADGWRTILPGGTGGSFHQLFREQQWAKSMVPQGTFFAQEGALKSMWVAFSFGPDRIADRLVTAEFPTYGILDYDPTNGTISRGDVIRHRE